MPDIGNDCLSDFSIVGRFMQTLTTGLFVAVANGQVDN